MTSLDAITEISKILLEKEGIMCTKICITENLKETYLIETDNEKYILKIHHKKTQDGYELITNTIKLLNRNDFPTAKLILSRYEEGKSYFIFEYLEKTQDLLEDENCLEEIYFILDKFYNLTQKITNTKEELSIKTHIKSLSKNFQSPYSKMIIKELSQRLIQKETNQRLLIVDINSSNFIKTSKGIYIIDFDELGFGEIEHDFADFFTDFIPTNIMIESAILKYCNFLSYFKNYDFDIEKIIDYIILILCYEIAHDKDRSLGSKKIQLLRFYYENKKFMKKQIEKNLHKSF